MTRIYLRRALVTGFVLMATIATGCGKRPSPSAEIDGSKSRDGGATSEQGSDSAAREDLSAWKNQLKDVFFDYDKAEIRSEFRSVLQDNGRVLTAKSDARITLEGHCDERGTEEYNLALGHRRAEAVKSYLTDLGVESSRLHVVSYGEEKPFAVGHDESAWSQNRRVHFMVP